MQPGDGVFGQMAQLGGEHYFTTPFAFGVEDGAAWDRDAKHLFQTKCLGAELSVVVFPLPTLAEFEFDGKQRTVGALLHDIALAVQAETVGEDRQGAKQRHALNDFVPGQVRVLVDNVSAVGVDVGGAPALDDLQRRPAGAVEMIVEKREWELLSRVWNLRLGISGWGHFDSGISQMIRWAVMGATGSLPSLGAGFMSVHAVTCSYLFFST